MAKKSPSRTNAAVAGKVSTKATQAASSHHDSTKNKTSPVAATSSIEEELRLLRAEVERLRSASQHQADLPAISSGGFIAKEVPEDRDERESYAEGLDLPGINAPDFNLVSDFLTFGVTPWADALVPAYMLDNYFRIVDWNLAFGLAFDRTMEGRRGQHVSEWVYFLDNYKAILDQGATEFNNTKRPPIHVEPIEYTSPRYGKIHAIKRAYQIPKDAEETQGWLVILEVKFDDLPTTYRFKRDVYETLRLDLTWSEYAMSYDRVLLASRVYHELIEHILGEQVPRGGQGELTRLPPRSRILDLGAGTGNLSLHLAKQQRGHTIFAVENNRMMLDLLRDKCHDHLRSDALGPGILAIKQDVNTLFGLPGNAFDFAILNNVAYSLEDPVKCFKEVWDSLKIGGEIRVSGPQKSTNLEKLFARIAADLDAAKRMTELNLEFEQVRQINQTILRPILFRWTVDDMKKMLLDAGFSSISYHSENAYGGQAMIVCAKKQRATPNQSARPGKR